MDVLTNELIGHLQELEAICNLVSPYADGPEAAALHEINRLGERYTMAQERAVHEQLIGEVSSKEAGCDVLAVQDEPPRQDLQPPMPAPESPAPGENDLGENVELF